MHSVPETPLFFRARRIGDGQTFESFRRFYFRIFGGNLICPSLTLPARKVQKIPVPIYASHRRILRFPVFSCQTHRPRTTREQANCSPHRHDSHVPHTTPIPQPTSTGGLRNSPVSLPAKVSARKPAHKPMVIVRNPPLLDDAKDLLS